MADQIKLDLDPKAILQSMNDISEQTKKLAQIMEDSLGKNAVKSIDSMEKAAQNGSNKISTHFRDLGKRISQDLKTAFNITGLMAGLKFADQIGQGIKEVFNLERAFDKLNTRLQLTGKNFQDFKKNVGTSIASTGQKLEDVFPGVEVAASKGNVKSPEELSSIGKALGQVRAATGESTEALADSVVEILRTQGKKVTAQTFQQTLDALQGTRISGSFKTAGEAGSAIQGITAGVSPEQLKAMGLGTRQLGGLAAQASKSGQGGQEILQHVLQMATQAGGKELINSIFGTQLFKGEKLDVGAFKNINKKQFGQHSEQVLASATGADQAQLSRFIDVMKTGFGDFKKVTSGADETASQFKTATNNLASNVDQFKERTKNATREIGEDLATAANELLKGNWKGALEAGKHGAESLSENKGVLGGAAGMSAAAAVMMGSGAGNLLGKIPGVGGLIGGQVAKATGTTPVYVTNAAEISSGGIAGKLGMFGLAGGAGAMAGSALANTEMGQSLSENSGLNSMIDKLISTFGLGGEDSAKQSLKDTQARSAERYGGKLEMTPENIANAVRNGVVSGMTQVNKNRPVQMSNPSRPSGIGGHQ